jgi:hypothetical protein
LYQCWHGLKDTESLPGLLQAYLEKQDDIETRRATEAAHARLEAEKRADKIMGVLDEIKNLIASALKA